MFNQMLRGSVSNWRRCWPDLVRVSSGWLLIGIACSLLVAAASIKLLLFAALLVHCGMASAVAVGWGRFILLGEKVSVFRFGIQERDYAWKMVGLGLLAGLVLFGLFIFSLTTVNYVGGYSVNQAAFCAVVLFALGAPVFLRLSLVLPAASIGEAFSIVDAWEVSAGLGLPMVALNAVFSFLLMTLSFLGIAIMAAFGVRPGHSLFVPLLTIVLEGAFVGLVLVHATTLSIAYGLAKQRWLQKRRNANAA